MLLNIFRPRYKEKEPEEEVAERKAGKLKSDSAEDFLKTAKAKSFIKKWGAKKKGGKNVFTKRGIIALLGALFQIPGLASNDEVLDTGEDLLSKLGGMDGLEGFLLGWKAKSEGLIKALKVVVGGK